MPLLPSLLVLSGWWQDLARSQQVFYGIAVLAACVILVMALLSMISFGDVDADALDVGDGSSLFSVKPITGFFFGFGWTGGAAIEHGASLTFAMFLAGAATRATAEGDAAAIRSRAEAEAEAIALKLKAEAEGKEALLNAQAEGLKRSGNTADAVQLIVAQQLVAFAEVQAEAIKGLKMDKIVVMGGGSTGVGASAVVQDFFRGVLPLHEVARAAGIALPTFLGQTNGGAAGPAVIGPPSSLPVGATEARGNSAAEK